MNSFIALLALLAVLGILSTLRLAHDGGRPAPPRSHRPDEQFLPPSGLVH